MVRSLIASVAAALALSIAGNAQAAVHLFEANLSGPNENPSNASPGFGFATVAIDDVALTLQLDVSFSGLIGNTTFAHIHCCVTAPGNVGVATQTPSFVGFPAGVTSGVYSNLFDLTLASSFNPAFVTAQGGVTNARTALVNGIAASRAYLNIHTSTFPGGEIRGFFVASIPEPATWAMMILGFGAVGATLRRRRPVAA